jgi:hypothetical protein
MSILHGRHRGGTIAFECDAPDFSSIGIFIMRADGSGCSKLIWSAIAAGSSSFDLIRFLSIFFDYFAYSQFFNRFSVYRCRFVSHCSGSIRDSDRASS